MSLVSQLNTNFNVTETANNGAGQAVEQVVAGKTTNWASGVGAGLASVCFASQRTLAGSATETLALIGGGLLDINNQTLALANVVAIYIRANDNNVDNVVFGNPATNGLVGPLSATGTVTIAPGTEFLAYRKDAGWTVTPSTAMNIKIADGGSLGVQYQIVIIGS